MNPDFHPMIGNAIAFLQLLGTVHLGQLISRKYFQRSEFLISLSVGFLVIAQGCYLLTFYPLTVLFIYPVALGLACLGILHLVTVGDIVEKVQNHWNSNSLLFHTFSLLLVLLSMGPPTNADALGYHWGVPVFLLREGYWPPTNIWLHGSLAGIGEAYNALGVALGAENLGTLLQSFSLLGLVHLVTRCKDNIRRQFITIFLVTSPVIIFLVTAPKPQLFPQVLTTLTLFLLLSEPRLSRSTFVLLCMLLMGAAQQKLSFLITGGILGLFALCRVRFDRQAIVWGIGLFLLFFLPRGVWNLSQVETVKLINFLTPLPVTFTDMLRQYRENTWWFPFNLFLPSSAEQITAILGAQFLILFFVSKWDATLRITLSLIFVGSIATYVLGQSVARSFLEFQLWLGVGFAVAGVELRQDNWVLRIAYLHAVGFLFLLFFSLYILLPGILSQSQREAVMLKSANEYAGIKWLNENLPKDAVLISGLRSVALLQRDFIPTDWMKREITDRNQIEYFERRKPTHLALKGPIPKEHRFFACVGDLLLQSPLFEKATRNPFNKGSTYSVYVYEFHFSELPKCLKTAL